MSAENLCNSSPVDHSNNTRTIFEEPGVFTPAKESEHDVVMVKQEIVTAVPFHDRIDVKRRRKRRFSRDEDQLTKIKSFKGSHEGNSSDLCQEQFTCASSEDSDSDSRSSGTIPLEDKNNEEIEIIDLTKEMDMEAKNNNEKTDLPNVTGTSDFPELPEVQDNVEVELSVHSPSSEEKLARNREFTFVNMEITTESPATENTTGQMNVETIPASATTTDRTSEQSPGNETCDNVSSIKNPEETEGERLSATAEVNVNEPAEDNAKQENGPKEAEEETANEFDIENEIENVLQDECIPLTFSFEYLDKEETRLREVADKNKDAAVPIERKRKELLKERQHFKSSLAARKTDLLAKARVLDATVDALASNSCEILKINDEQGKITSSIEEIGLKTLESRVQLAELQAELYRNEIKIQKKLCTDESLAEKIAECNKRIEKLVKEIAENEQLKQKLTLAARELAEKRKLYSHQDTVLRRKLEEHEIQHQASLKLVEECKLKLEDLTKQVRKTDKEHRIHLVKFMILERRMVAVQTCRRQKKIQERILKSLYEIREIKDDCDLKPTVVVPISRN